MALPKVLARMEAKLDEVLAILKQPPALPPENGMDETTIDPAAVAAALDYDTYTAREILARVASLEPWQRQALHTYEAAHANRKSVLEALSA